MFELSVALKYLVPRRRQLSVSLIALLSVLVISLVVWLVLIFLSVTEGIERGWLHKLTTLNAPLRITPTQEYYASYYYQIDGVASDSEYTLKNVGAKMRSLSSDPYRPEEDGELPAHFPPPDLSTDGTLLDPVKGLFSLLSALKHPGIAFQDFELSGALMRLQLLREGVQGDAAQGYLTQVSYLASLPDRCPALPSLLLPPTEKDLNHLFYLAGHTTELSRQDSPALTLKADRETVRERINALLRQAKVKELKPRHTLWQISPALLPENTLFSGVCHSRNGKLQRIDLPAKAASSENAVKVRKQGTQLILESASGKKEALSLYTPLLVDGALPLEVKKMTPDPLRFFVQGELQGMPISGEVDVGEFEISKAEFLSKTLSAPSAENETGVLLAKGFLENGVRIGDRGYLSYASATASSVLEHRLPIFVSGFYDPGILPIGNKCILVPPSVTQAINASSSSFNLDKTQSNGVLVWFQDIERASEIKREIEAALAERHIDRYWKVATFREYDFAKDLLQQFQSDKTLFTLIGVLILIVACCNIISLLVLLVNDKKREIGILQAMGASKLSIAAIFGSCGMAMGILSSILGISAAVFTMHHIDAIVHLLSAIQGHEAFNAAFFGKSLPSELSASALAFVLIATPLLSLLAGLVPAIKACRLRPSVILRAEQ